MTRYHAGHRHDTRELLKKRKPVKIQTLQFYIIRENGTPLPLQNKPGFLWMVAIFIAVSLLSVAGTAKLAAWAADSTLEIDRLEQKLVSLHHRHNISTNSRDLLLARVVVAEERANARREPIKPTPTVERKQKTVSDPLPRLVEEALLPAVDVRDFQISHDKESKTLKVEYSLINTQGKGEPVTGRAYVVLGEKPKVVSDIHRKRSSRNRLTSGNPFSIQRFKRIEFSVEDDILKKEVQSASVFVFTGTGELVIEKQWTIDIQSS